LGAAVHIAKHVAHLQQETIAVDVSLDMGREKEILIRLGVE
jgi:hypothetical protein